MPNIHAARAVRKALSRRSTLRPGSTALEMSGMLRMQQRREMLARLDRATRLMLAEHRTVRDRDDPPKIRRMREALRRFDERDYRRTSKARQKINEQSAAVRSRIFFADYKPGGVKGALAVLERFEKRAAKTER